MKANLRGKEYFFLIETTLYNRILLNIQKHNHIHTQGKHHLKIDVVFFFINLICHRENQKKNKSEYGYVPLKAEYLKKYHHQYKMYFKFLESHKYITIKTYSISKKKCKQYKLIKPDTITSFTRHQLTDFVFNQKVKSINQSSKSSLKSIHHLTKWLNPLVLKIDYLQAIKYLSTLKTTKSKLYNRRYLIEKIHHKDLYFHREGKDNRLHSILTNLPKDLRPFIRCESNKLVSLDIKSSQPYLLTGVVNLLFKNDEISLERLINSSIKNRKLRYKIRHTFTIMIQEIMGKPIPKGIRRFINLIQSDVYDYLGNNLSIELRQQIETPLGITDKFFNRKLGYKEIKHFDTLRDYCKVIMLEYLYSSSNNNEKRYLEVKGLLPSEVSEIIDLIKQHDKNGLAIFLQNLESYLILDKITKTISEQNPNIPLFTIHDSIITTPQYADFIRKVMTERLSEVFGIPPQIEKEEW